MSNLRDQLIKAAYNNPELRPKLLPLITKEAAPWRDLGMVDDPVKEITAFFEITERMHKNAQQYIKLVKLAYKSYGEDLVARLLDKKQKDLYKKVRDLLDMKTTFVRYTEDLEDLARQERAASRRQP